jgi:tRNA-Thr(GGU) m(6)t(6)A37 methyltransferase TsaA
MSFSERFVLSPIGHVKTTAVGDQVKDKKTISQIIIDKSLQEGLEGIEEFSNLFVIFYFNQLAPKPQTLKIHPRGRIDLPLRGVFATRTMLRPNAVGLTVVELLGVEDNVLTVRGLDAYDGTPVLDVKPYDPWDRVEKLRVAGWWKKLETEKQRQS